MTNKFLILSFLFSFRCLQAQETIPADTFCFAINEAVKAASLDWMPDYFGYWSDDVRDLKMQKTVRNIPNYAGMDSFEMVDQKLIFHSRIVAFKMNDTIRLKVYEKVQQDLKKCLSGWSIEKIGVGSTPDLFFTNREDDTSLRVSVSEREGITYFLLKIF